MKNRKGTGFLLAAVGSVAGVGAQGLPETGGQALNDARIGTPLADRFGVSAYADGWFPRALDGASAIEYGLGG
ncbi:MAG TPA: hypothetical protein PLI66_03850, partial [Spirochaetales bacterium]|nr:hypothetical protein [Spirochaetales bacterium]